MTQQVGRKTHISPMVKVSSRCFRSRIPPDFHIWSDIECPTPGLWKLLIVFHSMSVVTELRVFIPLCGERRVWESNASLLRGDPYFDWSPKSMPSIFWESANFPSHSAFQVELFQICRFSDKIDDCEFIGIWEWNRNILVLFGIWKDSAISIMSNIKIQEKMPNGFSSVTRRTIPSPMASID
jgi:hypothetical protein